MAVIVFSCIPAQGHTNPTPGVVRKLVGLGHEVLYYSYEPLRKVIEAAGARFIPCDGFDAQLRLTPEEGRQAAREPADDFTLCPGAAAAVDKILAVAGAS